MMVMILIFFWTVVTLAIMVIITIIKIMVFFRDPKQDLS